MKAFKESEEYKQQQTCHNQLLSILSSSSRFASQDAQLQYVREADVIDVETLSLGTQVGEKRSYDQTQAEKDAKFKLWIAEKSRRERAEEQARRAEERAAAQRAATNQQLRVQVDPKTAVAAGAGLGVAAGVRPANPPAYQGDGAAKPPATTGRGLSFFSIFSPWATMTTTVATTGVTSVATTTTPAATSAATTTTPAATSAATTTTTTAATSAATTTTATAATSAATTTTATQAVVTTDGSGSASTANQDFEDRLASQQAYLEQLLQDLPSL